MSEPGAIATGSRTGRFKMFSTVQIRNARRDERRAFLFLKCGSSTPPVIDQIFSPRWPRHFASTQNVHVDMEDRLAGAAASVDDGAIAAAVRQAVIVGDAR